MNGFALLFVLSFLIVFGGCLGAWVVVCLFLRLEKRQFQKETEEFLEELRKK